MTDKKLQMIKTAETRLNNARTALETLNRKERPVRNWSDWDRLQFACRNNGPAERAALVAATKAMRPLLEAELKDAEDLFKRL